MSHLATCIRDAAKAAGSFFISALVVVAFLALGVVQLRSCLAPGARGRGDEIPEIVAADPDDIRQGSVLDGLGLAFEAAGSHGQPALFVVQSPDLNAASLGDGRFLVWEGVADLPVEQIDAILAHEVAHDRLRHSRKYAELRDLTDFLASVAAVVTGSSVSTEERLQESLGVVSTSHYSRSQEAAADELAVEVLADLGYEDPGATLAATLCALLRVQGDAGGGWFDSHPATSERVRRLGAGPCPR